MVNELVDAFDTLGAHHRSQDMFSLAHQYADVTEQADLFMRQARHAETYMQDPNVRFNLFYQGAQSCINDVQPFIDGMRRAVWDGAENGIDTLLALLEAEEDWAGYITLLDEYAQLLQSDVEQAKCIFRAGEKAESELRDEAGALSRYLQAHRLSPETDSYALAIERIYRVQERWDLLDGLLERRLEAAKTRSSQVEIRLMQSEIRHTKLGEPVAAYDILRDALRLVDTHRAEPVYEAMAGLVKDMWAFPAIEEGLKARMETAEGPQSAAKLAQELSFLYLEFVNDHDTGFEFLRKAAAYCPEDPAIFERVTQQFEAHADDLVLARWLEAADERPLDARLKVDALLRALDIYISLGAEWPVCRRVWDALLRLDARDPEQIASAVQQAESAGDDGAIAQFLTYGLDGGAAQVASEFVRLHWMRRLADIHKEQGDLGLRLGTIGASFKSGPSIMKRTRGSTAV